MTAEPALRLDGISRNFGGLKALKEISAEFFPGERISVIGTNGAGKSTLFNLISGSLRTSSGSIHMFGEDLTKAPPQRRARRGLARTFQISKLFNQLTVLDNVFVALGMQNRTGMFLPTSFSHSRWEQASILLGRVHLEDRADTQVSELSYGEQRQLELAMALALEPKILMLDEPAAGLSSRERKILVEILENLPRDITLLLIEHDMDIALKLADRIIVMHDGAKILEGSPQDIRESTLVREIYLGGAVDATA